MPLFSVIIPLYNKENYISVALESVLAQTLTDFEIIVIDDGSTDGSKQITASFPDARIKYYYKENNGASSARNLGMQMATGEYFAFLDADDYWYPFHLKEIYGATLAMMHLKVFASLLEVEDKHCIALPAYSNRGTDKIEETDFFTASFARTILSGSTTVIHRDVAIAIGEFDTALVTAEDTDYWIRIGFEFKIGVINQVTARQNYVAGSLSKKRFKMENATYFEKFTERENNNSVAKKMIDLNRFSLALLCKIEGDKDSYLKLSSMISPQSLTFKQQLLLNLDGKTLARLKKFKAFLETKNIRLKVF